MTRAFVVALAISAAPCACTPLNDVLRPSIARDAPSPVTPLAAPTQTMKCDKGAASAKYPQGFGATVKPDGTILFPEGTVAKIKGSSIVVAGAPVLTVSDSGDVKGNGLKRPYRFTVDGELVDNDGHGVHISSQGGVRAMGGPYKYQDVLVWAPDGGGVWDKSAWRTLEIVALVLIENMLPDALTPPPPETKDGGAGAQRAKDEGGIYIPPPSQWFK